MKDEAGDFSLFPDHHKKQKLELFLTYERM